MGRGVRIVVLAVAAMLLAGCQAGAGVPTIVSSASPSASPSFACPIVEGQEPPDGCVPYDPQLLMDVNERYRDHMPISAEAFAPAQTAADGVRPALEQLRANGAYSPDAVRAVLEAAGLQQVAVSNGPAIVYFESTGPAGGCVFGWVNEDAVEVEVAGPIMDGGCVAATGH